MNSIETNQNVLQSLKQYGLSNSVKIADSLQGSVWLTPQSDDKQVVKVTSKALHATSSTLQNGQRYTVQEDIENEAIILKHLTSHQNAPNTIVKYIDFIESESNYYLLMEYGGSNLLDFVIQAHQLINEKKLDIEEWQQCVRVIYKQLLAAMHHMHSNGVCHLDLSLENIVISDVHVLVDLEEKDNIAFCHDSIQIKLIDFGLAEFAHERGDLLLSKFCGKPNYKSPEVTAQSGVFDGKLNDIWCSGVCLWMMIVGSSAFDTSAMNDASFVAIMNNEMIDLIDSWDRLDYITADIVHLLTLIFQYEPQRVSLTTLMKHHWLQESN